MSPVSGTVQSVTQRDNMVELTLDNGTPVYITTSTYAALKLVLGGMPQGHRIQATGDEFNRGVSIAFA